MRKVRRNKLRKTMSIPEVSLTPLIDTALTLLIIFMVTAPMMQSVIKVELPKAKAQASQDMNNESLMVALDGKGDIYLNKKKMTLEGLVEYFQKSVAVKKKNNFFFISGKKSLPYKKIIPIFDKIFYHNKKKKFFFLVH